MKIKAFSTHNSENLILVYDREARASLAKMAEVARYAVHPDYIAAAAPELEEDFQQVLLSGTELLSRIAAANKGQIKVTKSEMMGAFMAATFACTFFAAEQSPVPSLSSAIILLAQVTAVPFVGRLCLPPIEELFKREDISEESWELYERIRCWSVAVSVEVNGEGIEQR